MDEQNILNHIRHHFTEVEVTSVSGNHFFIHNPGGVLPPERAMPFATLMTNNLNDAFSGLDRPGVFRLNLGVGRETYTRLFGPPPTRAYEADSDRDYTVLDQLLPHPVYAAMFWVCVLCPSASTFRTLEPLLEEAYRLAVKRLLRKPQGPSPSQEDLPDSPGAS